jgi:hypothetical protein
MGLYEMGPRPARHEKFDEKMTTKICTEHGGGCTTEPEDRRATVPKTLYQAAALWSFF